MPVFIESTPSRRHREKRESREPRAGKKTSSPYCLFAQRFEQCPLPARRSQTTHLLGYSHAPAPRRRCAWCRFFEGFLARVGVRERILVFV